MGDRLEGKVVIITGGTSGIGYRTVEIFVEQGARVLIAARSEDVGQALAERLGDSAFFIRTDVTQEDDIKAQTMGMPGEDIILSPRARQYIPYSFECKNVERLQFWSAVEQCEDNCKDEVTPAIVIKKNRKDLIT